MKTIIALLLILQISSFTHYCRAFDAKSKDCGTCVPNYYLKEKNCLPAENPIENCEVLINDDNKKCFSCIADKAFVGEKCDSPKTPIESCEHYIGDGSACLSCKDKKIPSEDGKKCVAEGIIDNCDVNLLMNKNKACMKCTDSKMLFNVQTGKCEEKKLDNCLLFNKDGCTLCDSTHEITDKGECVKIYTEEGGISGILIAVLVVLAVGGIGAALYFFAFRKKDNDLEEEIM